MRIHSACVAADDTAFVAVDAAIEFDIVTAFGDSGHACAANDVCRSRDLNAG